LNKRRSVIAIYPASFDPITLGHVDVATRAAAIFDQLILAVYDRPLKTLLFSTSQRIEMAARAVSHLSNVRVETYAELTVEFAREMDASVIVRGLRTMSDFEREYGMAQLNRGLNSEVDVVCLMASQRFSYVSSSAVKEIAALGGPVDELVPEHVAQALRRMYGSRSES
jgi:pantetheine-phosphate adenylyltransferase